MDFDPGYDPEWMHGDSDFMGGDDAFDPESRDLDIEEFDDDGNPVYLAAAAGLGYHMSQDEVDERKLAEDILKRRERKEVEPTKVPLSKRHEAKGHMTPFGRWATKVNIDPKRTVDDIEYTKEEWMQILDAESE